MMQYYAGMAYLGAGKPRKAEELLGKAAPQLKRADAYLGHGNALYALKWNARAVTALQKATGLEPTNAAMWFNLGNAAQAAHDNDTAIAAFGKALECDPLLIQSLPNLMTILATTGRYGEIADLMQKMHRLGIWRALFFDVALIALPAAAAGGEKGDAVREALETLQTQNPEDGQVLCLLGNLFLMRGDFSKAETFYLEAAALPDQPGACRAAAVLLAERGEADLARTYLEKSVASDPEAEQVLKLANLTMQLSIEKIKSAQIFDTLRAVYAGNDTLYQAHGAWLSTLGDWKNLARVLEDRIKTHETAENLSNLGAAYMNLRQETAALKYLRRAVKLDRKKYPAWYNLSSVLTQQGKDLEAFEAGKKAFAINPKMVAAASQLALIAGKMNQAAESERILKRGLKHNPKSPELLNLMGNVKLKRGDTKGALDCFTKARENAADNGAEFAMQLMAVNYSATVPPEIVADMHFKWGDARVAAVKPCAVQPPAAEKPKLKIGIMSGDFKNHSCAFFLKPLLDNFDPRRIDVYCYMTEDYSDEITLTFRRTAKHWREIGRLGDEEAAALIQEGRHRYPDGAQRPHLGRAPRHHGDAAGAGPGDLAWISQYDGSADDRLPLHRFFGRSRRPYRKILPRNALSPAEFPLLPAA